MSASHGLAPITILAMVAALTGFSALLAPGFVLERTRGQQTGEGLTQAHGVDLVRERCLLCHNEDVVVSQHLSRARWSELLDWMVTTQGMAELPPDVRDGILDYLETTQPPRELSLEDSPWASPRYRPNPIW